MNCYCDSNRSGTKFRGWPIIVGLACAAGAIAALAAQEREASRTVVNGQRMGETGQEFAASTPMPGICAGKTPPPASMKKQEVEAACRAQSDIEAGKREHIKAPPFDYHFSGNRLVHVVEAPGPSVSFRALLARTVEKYGKPTLQGSMSLQNGSGESWTVGYAKWNMPDGVEVRLFEMIRSGERYSELHLATKEEAAINPLFAK